MSDLQETGAIDWLLIETPGRDLTGALVPPLLDLVHRRLFGILDAVVIVKGSGDDFDVLASSELELAR